MRSRRSHAYLPTNARVLRDGDEQVIEAAAAGARATCWSSRRAIASRPTPGCSTGALEVDLSTLTGESLPAFRSAELADSGVPLLQARDLVF